MLHPTSVGKQSAWLLAGIASAALAAGCGEGQDHKVEADLKAAMVAQGKRTHYPVFQFPDYGSDNAIRGVNAVVYGTYCKIQTQQNEHLNALTPTEATEKLASFLSRAIQTADEVQKSTPPPSKVPTGRDWTDARHPKSGSYDVLLQYPGQSASFTVDLGEKDSASSQAAIRKQAADLIERIRKDESDNLHSPSQPGIPAGFSASAEELIGGSGGPAGGPPSASSGPPVASDPFIHGSPLLLVPLDRALALKGIRATFLTILDRVRKRNPSAKVANVVLVTPFDKFQNAISTEPGTQQETDLQRALEAIGKQIDLLNDHKQ